MAVKDLKYAALYDVYGGLLSEKQSYALEMYYCDDLSLAEIAEHIGITRQGVRDQIKHAEEELERFEEKLGLARKSEELRKILSDIDRAAEGSELGERIKSLTESASQLIDN
ncbi:MAG: DNA-binding protein [Clostridia bacterium]|nr:DNA-binding protein [Clostridia bacterium]